MIYSTVLQIEGVYLHVSKYLCIRLDLAYAGGVHVCAVTADAQQLWAVWLEATGMHSDLDSHLNYACALNRSSANLCSVACTLLHLVAVPD